MNDKLLKVDQIDRGLGCVRLCWRKLAKASDSLNAKKEYAIIPAESIPEVVNGDDRNLKHCHRHPSAYQKERLTNCAPKANAGSLTYTMLANSSSTKMVKQCRN